MDTCRGACGEGFVHRHMPHTVRSLPWFATPLASHPGLRTIRHCLCCAVASHSCAMGYEYLGSAFPCHGVVGPLSIPFLLAVPFDRRLIWFSDCYESDSAPLRSRLPSGSKRFHEWRRLHTAVHVGVTHLKLRATSSWPLLLHPDSPLHDRASSTWTSRDMAA